MGDFLIPARPRWLVPLTLCYGIGTFVWLSWEDRGWFVLGLGLLGVVLFTAHGVFRLVGQRRLRGTIWFLGLLGCGGLIGAGTGLLTALLMFFKNAVHAHVYPDYSLPLMAATVQRMPAWGLAGVLVGLSITLVSSSIAKLTNVADHSSQN